uniref:Uncharacterized protein n=1 Tax=Manihot esculenta TaxID=3983 RepID=A0A2C9VCC7_MANES
MDTSVGQDCQALYIAELNILCPKDRMRIAIHAFTQPFLTTILPLFWQYIQVTAIFCTYFLNSHF